MHRLRLASPPSPWRPCRHGRVRSWELLPILHWFQDLGPRQALGVAKNRDSLWLTPVRSGRPVWLCVRCRRRGPCLGPEGSGGPVPGHALPCLGPSLPVRSSPRDRCPSQLPVPRGDLGGSSTNSFLCPGHSGAAGLRVNQMPEQLPAPQSEREDRAGDLKPRSARAMGGQAS